MHTKSDHKEFMTYDNANDIVDKLFQTLLSRYQDNLDRRMEGSEFVFASVQFFYYKCDGINVRGGGSYVNSLDWIKNKKATINQKNKSDKCFQHAINYISKIDEWKTFEKNNLTIAYNILYTKEKEMCPVYISKINSNCQKQIILLTIPNEEKTG